MLTLNWLKDQNNVVYAKQSDIVPVLARDLRIPDLAERIEAFRGSPSKEGIIVKGNKRSSARLFIPNLLFDEQIEMGESVWLYIGEMYPAYCIFVPWEENCV